MKMNWIWMKWNESEWWVMNDEWNRIREFDFDFLFFLFFLLFFSFFCSQFFQCVSHGKPDSVWRVTVGCDVGTRHVRGGLQRTLERKGSFFSFFLFFSIYSWIVTVTVWMGGSRLCDIAALWGEWSETAVLKEPWMQRLDFDLFSAHHCSTSPLFLFFSSFFSSFSSFVKACGHQADIHSWCRLRCEFLLLEGSWDPRLHLAS